MKIGEFLKYSRKKAKLTQKEMAALCVVTQTTISRYENDKRLVPFDTFMTYLINGDTYPEFGDYVCKAMCEKRGEHNAI